MHTKLSKLRVACQRAGHVPGSVVMGKRSNAHDHSTARQYAKNLDEVMPLRRPLRSCLSRTSRPELDEPPRRRVISAERDACPPQGFLRETPTSLVPGGPCGVSARWYELPEGG
jgi:hypothetical protein